MAKKDPDEYVRHFAGKEAVDDIQESLAAATATAKKQGPGHKSAIHGMAVVGFEKIYLYHLPMFNQEHGVQMILEVSFDEEAGIVYRQQSGRGVPYGLMTFVPQEAFPLLELGNTRMSFKGDLYEGHFERGGTKLAASVEATIAQVVYLHELNPLEARPEFPEYILFGSPRETFLAHKITAVPNYDQILNVSHTNPPERPIVDGAIVASLGKRDSTDEALKKKERMERGK